MNITEAEVVDTETVKISVKNVLASRRLQQFPTTLRARVAAFLRKAPSSPEADQAWDLVFELVWNPFKPVRINKEATDAIIEAAQAAGFPVHPDRRG